MRLRLVVLTAALAAVLPACHRPPGTRTDQHETHTFAAAPGKLVRLDLRSLDADVEVVTGDSIEVETMLEARSSSRAAARRWIERNTPEMDDSPSRLEISAPRRENVLIFGFMHTRGRLKVKLPAQCALEIHTASGDVSLGGSTVLSTPVRVDTSSGDVTVRGGVRELLIDTSSGDVRVSGDALAVLEASTSSGDVRLEAGAARAVIDTSSGDVRLRNLGGDLTATTSSGDVEARWSRLAAGAKVKVESSSGDVTLRLPAGASTSGEVTTDSGSIQSEFPGAEDRHGHHFRLSGGGTAPEQAPAAAPSVALSVETTSGDIRLVKVKLEV